MTITVGVLALQGGVIEHINLLRQAAASSFSQDNDQITFAFNEVRTTEQLQKCDALIIPGGESTTMAIVARRLGLFDALREFVKVQHKPVWGTCAGLVMLAEEASATKQGGQELVGGLDVKVLRNRYGTQIQSFVADLSLKFLGEDEKPFRGVFIRAPVVEEIISPSSGVEDSHLKKKGKSADGAVEIMGVYKNAAKVGEEQGDEEDIVAVRQGNVFGTSFHPELTGDVRIHAWWLRQVVDSLRHKDLVVRNDRA
ncbi:PdxT/SNO family [Podospora australis]|uniref:glutaminase n=1 Tax=Podospora australis TaxID=1536484 RepID=A0AAN6WTL8_9PEZI|nr:PdxT/SNO family [Podospora australis]